MISRLNLILSSYVDQQLQVVSNDGKNLTCTLRSTYTIQYTSMVKQNYDIHTIWGTNKIIARFNLILSSIRLIICKKKNKVNK
jgi:hypothetical protein